MVRLLTVDAPWDLPTIYLSAWMEKLIAEARQLGVEVLSLRGFLTPEGLADAIEQFQPDKILMGGHGGPNVFTTENMQVLLVGCTNDQMLTGRETLLFSCLTGQQLVPSIVSKGGVAAAGFTAEFVWVVTPPYLPDEDAYAKPFERLFVEPMLEVLRGAGWSGWYDKLQSVAREEERVWSQSEDPLSAQIVLSLIQDRRAATWLGEGGGVAASMDVLPLLALVAIVGSQIS